MKEKIKERSEVAQLAKEAKDAGKKVVFTNGCFDLIHIGHIRLLEEAKKQGDILVVALNTDDSVHRLKGDKRPVTPQEERLAVVAALQMVDWVTLFDEDTPAEIIEEICPDVLVKGGDYKPGEVVGREFVEKSGGRLHLIPLVKGKSSTKILNEF